MKSFARFLHFSFLPFLLLSCSQQKSKKPNVVLIVADDLGFTDLGCYGSTFYETPNLDALASDGVRFTNGYASCPVCSPSRASIQTGKYPVKVGITDWIPGRAFYSETTERNRFLSAELENQLALNEVTVAEYLKTANFKTFFAGKWHLGETEDFWPEHQGYDKNIAGWKKGSPNLNAKMGVNGFFSPYGNPRITDGPEGEYLPRRLADEVNAFIDSSLNDNFYVCLSFYLVHTPLQAQQKAIEKYKAKATQLGLDTVNPHLPPQDWMFNNAKPAGEYKERIIQSHAVYAAMVEALDENIGHVIQKLKEEGLYENSLILFTSDNGGLSTAEGSPTSNLPLRAGKGWLYEGGIRVPFIIKYPNGKFAQTVSSIPVSGIDVLPTVLAGLNLDVSPSGIDGINITRFLEDNTTPERPLFWHYPHYSNQGGNPGSVIIEGDFKLIHDFEKQQFELYNLKDDVGEHHNLSNEFPEKVDEMYKKLDMWRKSNNAKMMVENSIWNGKD
jgi:arylsulfatase A-like enzyme